MTFCLSPKPFKTIVVGSFDQMHVTNEIVLTKKSLKFLCNHQENRHPYHSTTHRSGWGNFTTLHTTNIPDYLCYCCDWNCLPGGS